jgi:8-oxo-dGTP diphosphatase
VPATFPCIRCGQPLRRTRDTPPHLACPRCRYLIFDYPRACAGTIVLKGDRVLVLRRKHLPKRGYLDIPGGFMEAGESFEQAARRELREETGLMVGRATFLGMWWDKYFLRGFGSFPTMNFYYLARWRSGEPVAADDAASAEWIRLADLGRHRSRFAWSHMTKMFRAVRRHVRR